MTDDELIRRAREKLNARGEGLHCDLEDALMLAAPALFRAVDERDELRQRARANAPPLRADHPWVGLIRSKLDGEWIAAREVTVHEVMTDMLHLDMTRISSQGSEAQRVGQALSQLGWVKSRPRKSGGRRQNVWLRPVG